MLVVHFNINYLLCRRKLSRSSRRYIPVTTTTIEYAVLAEVEEEKEHIILPQLQLRTLLL